MSQIIAHPSMFRLEFTQTENFKHRFLSKSGVSKNVVKPPSPPLLHSSTQKEFA